MSSQDYFRLDLLLRMIGHLRRRLTPITLRDFLADIDEMDLTAFRLQVIGETASKLSSGLKERNPQIKWPAIYAMRNIIVHAYGAIEHERLWTVFVNDIDPLAEVCERELGA